VTIKEMLECTPGTQFTDGDTFTIKKTKKKWETTSGWMHQVLLTDKTGDILADVDIGSNIPLQRNQQINLIAAEIQPSEGGAKLYVDVFELITQIGEPPMDYSAGEPTRIVRGKIKCWLVAGKVQAGFTAKEILVFAKSDELKQIIDSIMEG
jgi:hypothetical protein